MYGFPIVIYMFWEEVLKEKLANILFKLAERLSEWKLLGSN